MKVRVTTEIGRLCEWGVYEVHSDTLEGILRELNLRELSLGTTPVFDEFHLEVVSDDTPVKGVE